MKCDNNPEFDCPINDEVRDKTCRKDGYCPVSATLDGMCGQ